jgi:potassium-transporting ATPase KdpC subunit
MKSFYQATMMLVMMTVLCGIGYPIVLHVFAQTLLVHKANGSLISNNGTIVGSDLVGQKFDSDRYFWPRPSACDYQTLPSGASNLGPTSTALKNVIATRRAFFAENFGINLNDVPTDMITTSASGLDPHISFTSARMQAPRIARARNFSADEMVKLNNLITKSAEERMLATSDEKIINVVILNVNLDKI